MEFHFHSYLVFHIHSQLNFTCKIPRIERTLHGENIIMYLKTNYKK